VVPAEKLATQRNFLMTHAKSKVQRAFGRFSRRRHESFCSLHPPSVESRCRWSWADSAEVTRFPVKPSPWHGS
jgi:hypothetical protein